MARQTMKYRPLIEQIVEKPEETWTERGLRRGLISVSADGSHVTYPQCGNEGGIYSEIYTDPEAQVRTALFVELVEKYKYPSERIWVEKHVSDRRPDYPADLIVYEDAELKQPYILVETKKKDVSETEFNRAIEQGFENANLIGGVKFVVVDCGTRRMVFDYANHPPGERRKNVVREMPVAYGNVPEYKYIKGDPDWDLPAATFDDLTRRFQRCHDAIWQGGKLDPAQAFDEMSKLMFAKYWDELLYTKNGEPYSFQIGTKEEEKTVADRVRELYQDAREQKRDVFGEDLKIPDHVLRQVVGILEDVSLKKTDLDAKGRAFETFLSEIFRGKMGQYFTKREIVTFMVNMLDPEFRDSVVDPACGSGGFLLYAWDHVRRRLIQDFAGDGDTIKTFDIRFANEHIFGIEINDRIARIAMMDMVIHEDGSSNIVCADAMDSWDTFPQDKIGEKRFNMCLTNPPFGAVVKHQAILKQFELGCKRQTRASQKTEILFIERCLQLLKPGGKLGIVLPDGILTNSSLDYVRKFIEENVRILAVVSLPQHAFVPAGAGVKASLLFLQKFTIQQKSRFDRTARRVRQEVEEKYSPIIAEREREIEAEVMAERETLETDLCADAERMAEIEKRVMDRKGRIEKQVRRRLEKEAENGNAEVGDNQVQVVLEAEIKAQIEAEVQKQVERELKEEFQQKLRSYRQEVEAEMEEETWRRIRERLNYPILMAIAEHVGYDATDRPDENDLLVVDEEGRIDETRGILGEYKCFLTNPSGYDGLCMRTEYGQIEGRFDPNYYRAEFVEIGQMFAGSPYEFERLGKYIVDIRYGASVENIYVDSPDGIPLLRITNLRQNEIHLSDVVRLNPALKERIRTAYVREGDLLISRSGTIGIVAVVSKAADSFAYGSFMIRFRVNTEILNPHYVSIICNSLYGHSYFERNTIGAIQGNITISTIKAFEIPIPPLERQKEIVAIIQTAYAERRRKLQEAEQVVETATAKVETMILGQE